jgi:ATP-dependent Clp protease ATP-binding subunit ClpA
VLLFDEIEKAHGKIMDKFLQILEDGRLTDSRGQTADFSQSVIIFTSNIGSDSLSGVPAEADGQPAYESVRQHYLAAVRDHFKRPTTEKGLGRPELLNRFGDNILVFDVLRPDSIRAIARKFQTALSRNAAERHGLRVSFAGDEVGELIERTMRANPRDMEMGGRRVRTLMEERVLKPLNRHVFENNVTSGGSLTVGVRNNEVVIC